MDKQVKRELDSLNGLRDQWLDRLGDLSDEDLAITAEDGYWTIRKWLCRMIDHEAIHLGQVVRIRRSIEPVWRAAVRWREVDRLIGELHSLRGRLASELVGLSDELLDARPPDGPKSVREVLAHLHQAEEGYVEQIEKLRGARESSAS